jgi:hypothetical protein
MSAGNDRTVGLRMRVTRVTVALLPAGGQEPIVAARTNGLE